MVSEEILWKWVLSLAIVFPESWGNNSPQDVPLACITLPPIKQNRPLFFSKTGLIFRVDKTILIGPKDQNVYPTGMKNDTDRGSNFPWTKLHVPKKHTPGHLSRGPFQVLKRAAARNSPQSAYSLREPVNQLGLLSTTRPKETLTSFRKKGIYWLV